MQGPMFHEHHHRSFFPVVLVGLTLVLVFVVLFATGPFTNLSRRGEIDVPTSERYEAQVQRILFAFDERFNMADATESRVFVAVQATDELLALVVPADLRDLHLELIITLNRLRQDLEAGNAAAVDASVRRLEELHAQL